MLAECGWLFVVASLAQVVAAFLATWTIIQARKVIQQADEERRLSVAPDWRVGRRCLSGVGIGGAAYSKVRVVLVNAGFGSGLAVRLRFTPNNGNEPVRGPVIDVRQYSGIVLPEKSINISLEWHHDKPLDGTLVVSCTTRLGSEESTRFHLCTAWRADQGQVARVPPDDCHISRLEDMPKSHKRWRWPWQKDRAM